MYRKASQAFSPVLLLLLLLLMLLGDGDESLASADSGWLHRSRQ